MDQVINKKESMPVLLSLFDWHTKLFLNALDGLEDKDAATRLNTDANHIAWIAGSLVYERFTLAKSLGLEVTQAHDELFRDGLGIQEGAQYPSLHSYRDDWEAVSPLLKNALQQLDEEGLKGKDPFGMPGDATLFDSVTFITHREAYCIGQIGLWRRLLGYAATKFD